MLNFSGLENALRARADQTMALARQYGLNPTITSVRRNWAEQQKLYDRWNAGLSRWPANPPGLSPHQYGVAWDSSVPAHQQDLWNRIRAAMGWKLYAHDIVHAELPNWRAYIRQLRLT